MKTDKECPFCDIARGAAPGRIVYRDDKVIAFFVRHPRAKGHTLVCPVQHHADMFDMPEGTFRHLMAVTQRLAHHFRDRLGATGANILNASGVDAQQSVLHYHLHLLPRFPNDEIDAWPRMPVWEGDLGELLEIVRMDVEDKGNTQPPAAADGEDAAAEP